MPNIRCKTCGRTYSYEKQGMCPKCGAYNRPLPAGSGSIPTAAFTIWMTAVPSPASCRPTPGKGVL